MAKARKVIQDNSQKILSIIFRSDSKMYLSPWTEVSEKYDFVMPRHFCEGKFMLPSVSPTKLKRLIVILLPSAVKLNDNVTVHIKRLNIKGPWFDFFSILQIHI